jgi:hypothetical protein
MTRTREEEPRRYTVGSDVTRSEHVAWCKKRALEYLDAGSPRDAVTSMISDLRKCPETVKHPGALLAINMVLAGRGLTPAEVRKWIEGFN